MSRTYRTSDVLSGIIEDIDIFCLKQSVNPLRLKIEGIEELAGSIKQKGLLNPLTVRISDSQTFEIVAGLRRFQACRMLGWRKLPCHVVNLDEKESFVVSLIENIQRHSLSVIEEAMAYKRFVESFGWGGMTEIANSLGKSTSYVTKKIQLLDLPQPVLDSVVDATLKPSIAEELCSIKDEENQTALAQIIVEQKLSFRKTRQLVKLYELDSPYAKTKNEIRTEKITKSFDKAITALRLAMSRIVELTENNSEDDFLVKKLMYHKNLLHEQIDELIREKISLTKHR